MLDDFEALVLVICARYLPEGASAYDVKREDPALLLLLGTKGRKAAAVMARMTDQGLLEGGELEANTTGKRVRRYRPTARGRAAFLNFVREPARVPVVDPAYTLRLAGTTGHDVRDLTCGLLATRPSLRRALAEVEAERARRAEAGPVPLERELLFDLRQRLLTVYADWLGHVETRLEEAAQSPEPDATRSERG